MQSDVQAKRLLRQAMRARLSGLSPAWHRAASQAIASTIASLPEWQAAPVAASFAPLPSEPDILALALASGKTILLPRVEGAELEWHEVCAAGQLRPGAFGVPTPDRTRCPARPLSSAGAVLVPGLAFDRQGGRIGRGKGYYDRALAALPPAVARIGVAFDFQCVPSLPCEAHDVRVSMVVTERAVIRIG